MNAQDKAVAARGAAAKKSTARKSTAKADPKAKAPTPKGAKAAPKKPRAMMNAGTCSVRGCAHPAKRRGLCSGKGSENHYRKALRAERTLNK